MVSHFSDKCVFKSSFLTYLVSIWPVGHLSWGPRQGQMHTSISVIQLFRMCMIHGFPVGQLVGSWLWATKFSPDGAWGKQRGCGDDCRWRAVGTRTFPLIKKETLSLGIPNLWKSGIITRIPHKRNTCQSGGIPDQSVWAKRRLQEHHVSQWCQNFPILLPSTLFHHGPRNEDPENKREGTLHKWAHWCFLVGPLGLSRGQGNIE